MHLRPYPVRFDPTLLGRNEARKADRAGSVGAGTAVAFFESRVAQLGSPLEPQASHLKPPSRDLRSGLHESRLAHLPDTRTIFSSRCCNL